MSGAGDRADQRPGQIGGRDASRRGQGLCGRSLPGRSLPGVLCGLRIRQIVFRSREIRHPPVSECTEDARRPLPERYADELRGGEPFDERRGHVTELDVGVGRVHPEQVECLLIGEIEAGHHHALGLVDHRPRCRGLHDRPGDLLGPVLPQRLGQVDAEAANLDDCARVVPITVPDRHDRANLPARIDDPEAPTERLPHGHQTVEIRQPPRPVVGVLVRRHQFQVRHDLADIKAVDCEDSVGPHPQPGGDIEPEGAEEAPGLLARAHRRADQIIKD